MEARLQEILDKAARIQAERDMLLEQEQSWTQEISKLREDILITDKVEELFKFLLHKYVYKYADSFSSVVTEGMKTIFWDQEVTFNVDVQQKHGKVWVEFNTVQNGVSGQPLESFGGGLSSVQSLILRLLVLLKSGMARYLILDESLAALSADYVPTCAEFLRKMCDELDVNVLLITHNKDFLEHSDVAYQAFLSKDETLQLKKIQGN